MFNFNLPNTLRNSILAIMFSFMWGCTWFNDLPIVSTHQVTEVTTLQALCGGNVSDDGGERILARGVQWSHSKDFSDGLIAGITTDGAQTGSFTSQLTGLTANTTYYVRAYATNINGTGYGKTRTFTSAGHTGPTVTDIDGNVYNTIVIGHQQWMVENLKTTRFRDGTAINYTTSNPISFEDKFTGSYSWYKDDINYKEPYGALYTWYAVNNEKGLCPQGWRVPALHEWQSLIYLIGDPETSGGLLKERGVLHWNSPNTGGLNSVGFTALPGSWRDYKGTFGVVGNDGIWWSSTNDGVFSLSLKFVFNDSSAEFLRYASNWFFSVRCLKE